MLATAGAERVLDVGCGAGRHLLYLARRGFEVHGFDVAESATRQAAAGVADLDCDAGVTVADIVVGFPYEDESFDAALAFRSIHHADLAAIEHCVAELDRVLRPGASLSVQVPTYEKLQALREAGEEFEAVEPGTNVPLEGPEKGVPHHNFRRAEVLEVFSPFELEELTQRGDQYCLLARKP